MPGPEHEAGHPQKPGDTVAVLWPFSPSCPVLSYPCASCPHLCLQDARPGEDRYGEAGAVLSARQAAADALQEAS